MVWLAHYLSLLKWHVVVVVFLAKFLLAHLLEITQKVTYFGIKLLLKFIILRDFYFVEVHVVCIVTVGD